MNIIQPSITLTLDPNNLVLAFDIEKAGAYGENPIIGLGACVLDHNLQELDRLMVPAYFENETNFEPLCWSEFWSKNLKALESIKATGIVSQHKMNMIMIFKFQEFRGKWEQYAKDNNKTLLLVTDNACFDGGELNDIISRQLDQVRPMPYLVTEQEKYGDLWETSSIIKGILLANGIKDISGTMWDTLNEVYYLPPVPENSLIAHNPADDAFGIAFKAQIIFNIDKFKKKTLYPR